jgi:hypothetical protein
VHCREVNVVTYVYVSKRTEERIAMAGKRAVPFLPGKRRVGEVPDGHLQRFLVVSLSNGGSETNTRNLKTSDRSSGFKCRIDNVRSKISLRPVE